MKKLTICPATLQSGFDTYSPLAVKKMFDGQTVSHIIDFDFENEHNVTIARESLGKMSISGAQEKFSAVVDQGRFRFARPGEQSTFILKPAPLNYISTRKQIPANEHLTMQIASQVFGIRTAYNALCFTPKGQPVYVTRRFDVNPDLSKCPMEDFASLLGMTEQGSDSDFKYNGNYAMIADAIRAFVPSWAIETERFFKLIVFNYMFANGDAHVKNFSLINQNGEYFLAPAYDLINTKIHLEGDDFALKGGLSPDIEPSDAMLRTGHPCRTDFEHFAERIALPKRRAERVLDLFSVIQPETYNLIDRSFLNDKMKRLYKRVIEQRQQWFIRS